MPRIFVAVRMPEALRLELAALQAALERRIADVKWVEPANLHLTLRFFGELAEAETRRVADVVAVGAEACTAFPLELAGAGCFPERGRPRVIWAGISRGAEALGALAARLDDAFGAAGLGREDRPFRAHLTLGRLRAPDRRRRGRPAPPRVPRQAVPEIHAALAAARCGPLEMTVESVAVVESLLRPQGPLYREVCATALARPAAGR